ncbi:MAG: hypothetical protein ABMA64_38685 [Myxococcota bacterium]
MTTVSLSDHVSDNLLAQLARVLCGTPLDPGFVERVDLPDIDADLEPFYDWDSLRCAGRGYFATDPLECASRRIDLRGPTDLDPGPLPMEEAPDDITASAWHLSF